MAECQPRQQARRSVIEADPAALPLSRGSLESLWVRLKAGGRIRPRDAQRLRRLAVPPFDRGTVYELNAQGYVIAAGAPGTLCIVDHGELLVEFEHRFGIPESFENVVFLRAH